MAAVLRCARLDHSSLWIDELQTWYNINRGAPMGLTEVLENIHGPLYALLLHGWVRLAGDSEWALRAPSVLFGVLTVPALAWLASRWLGRDAAAPAAWLAAGSPFLVWYSQEARNYSLLVLCVALAMGALVAMRERVSAGRLVLYAGATATGLLSNFSFVLLAPAHVRAWFASGPARAARLRAMAVTAALALLVALPWVPRLASTWDWSRLRPQREAVEGETPLRGATTFHAGAVPYALHTFAVGYTLGPSLRELKRDASAATLRRHAPALAATALVFGALGLAGLAELRRRRRLGDALLWIAVPLVAVSYAAIQNFKVFHPRYVAVTLPALLLVVAAGLLRLPRPARAVAAIAIVGLWSVSLAQFYGDPAYVKDDFRAACREVSARARPGETVIAAGAEDPVIYYYVHRFHGRLPVNTYWLGFSAHPVRMDAEFDLLTRGAAGAWVIVGRSEDLDPAGAFERRLGERYPGAERIAYAGVNLWHIPREAGLLPRP